MKDNTENLGAEQVILTKEQYEKLFGQNEKLLSENEYLKQQLKELKRLIFGSKSERFVPVDGSQLSLFDGPGQETKALQTEEIKYTREKPVKEKQQPVTFTFTKDRGNS